MSRARAHRLALALFAAATLAATARAGSGTTDVERDARLAAWDASEASRLESFILSFPEETDDLDRALDELPAGSRVRRLRRTLRGAVLRLRASQARAFAERHPSARLERDAVVTAQGFRTSAVRRTDRNRDDDDAAARVASAFASESASASASASATPSGGHADRSPLHWGLDRVDQRRLPLDGRATRDASAGAGAVLYVVDSGVSVSHADFGGRARVAHDAFAGTDISVSSGTDDCFGHGTAVASLAAGKQAGIAPAAAIVSIRVLDCDGNGLVSDVVSGLESVAEHLDAARDGKQNPSDADAVPSAVMTLSLGVPAGRASRALDAAVRALATTRNVAVVAAAGNSAGSARRDDACAFSPGRARGALTVGASNADDRAWVDGMTGRCVDLFAPGVGVLGASHVRDDAFAEWTGTSMAAPAVAGAILAAAASRGTDGPSAAAGVLAAATRGALWDERDEVDAFADDHGDDGVFEFEGGGWGARDRNGGVTFPWGRVNARAPPGGFVLPGTPNRLLFHRE